MSMKGCAVLLALLGPWAVAPVSAGTAVTATAAARTCPPADTVPAGELSTQIQAVACVWAQRRLLIVGELHGTKETPGLVVELVRNAVAHHRAVRLGLEIPVQGQAALQSYIRSLGYATDQEALLHAPFWHSNDGRSSTAMLRLIDDIRQMRASGHDVDLFAMEPVYPQQAEMEKLGGFLAVKEEGMAKAISHAMENNKGALVIALMGNFHSRYAHQFEGTPNGSVTERLASYQPEVLLPFARKTSAWNCMSSCGVHTAISTRAPQGVLPKLEVANTSDGLWVVRLWLSEFTAALPAVKGTKD